ncbi:hypothetical protein FQN54_002278 [Arachnomyces sp. PD_36]|nr:hypothetical protein FQN54_002278 [Arachnomyces sp. PD_36]
MSSPTTMSRATIARLFAFALLAPTICAFDINAEPDPAQANHPLITPPPKLPSQPQKRDYLQDCFGDEGSCNMYMTVNDLCEILADEDEEDLANNQCLCSNGYVPALSLCEQCQLKYNTEIIYPASLASSSCLDDGFSIAKMSSKIPLSIEDLVQPTLLPPSHPTTTEPTKTTETSESTSTESEESESEETSSKQFVPVGLPAGGGGDSSEATATEARAATDTPLQATQSPEDGGAMSIRGGWVMPLVMLGGSMLYHTFA